MRALTGLLGALVLACASTATQADVISSGLAASSYTQSSSWSGGTAQTAFNGGGWNSGNFGWQWIQVDLGSIQSLSSLSLRIDQAPSGFSWTKVFVSDFSIGSAWQDLFPVAVRNDYVTNGQVVDLQLHTSGRFVQLVEHGGQSWTAAGDVKVFGASSNVPEPTSVLLAAIGLSAALLSRRRKA